MTARPSRRRDLATRREIIANWLALLALLALGIVWPGEEEPSPETRSAYSLRAPAAAGADARNARQITRVRPACAHKAALG